MQDGGDPRGGGIHPLLCVRVTEKRLCVRVLMHFGNEKTQHAIQAVVIHFVIFKVVKGHFKVFLHFSNEKIIRFKSSVLVTENLETVKIPCK